MKTLGKPIIENTRKSFRYTFRDRRKLVSLLIVLFIPVLDSVWRWVPEGVPFFYYHDLSVFIYHLGTNLLLVAVAIAWFLTIHRRDFALQIIALVALFYGIFKTYDTLPLISEQTPLWLDLLASFLIFLFISFYLYYIHKNYVNRKVDYKVLHDGIVHDLHHERFLSEISRIEGLVDIGDMEEPYKSMCRKEISKLKGSVAYIADKYTELK